MNMVVKINYVNDDLWCIYSKEKINIGEKYIIVKELYNNRLIEKTYKFEYKDFIDYE